MKQSQLNFSDIQKIMTAKELALFLPDLCRRLQLDPDRVLDLARDGDLPLWITFFDVFVHQPKSRRAGKKPSQPPVPVPHARIDLKPQNEILEQLRGRCDRMLITAELPCLDPKGNALIVTNSVGEEWGETSMIGLQPAQLYAKMEDVLRLEQACGVTPPSAAPDQRRQPPQPAQPGEMPRNTPDHPCYSEPLALADQCWQRLFSQGSIGAYATKEAIRDWIREQYPHLSKKTAGRIARIILPSDER